MDLQGGLVKANKVVPQALSLILSDVEEEIRSQMLPTANGEVGDKKANELVKGVDGPRLQSHEPGSC